LQQEELTLSVLRNITEVKTQKSLALDIGVSVGKVNYVLKALIEKGFIKADNFFANKNKNQYKYLLTQKGLEEKISLTKKFIDRKKTEYEELQNELKILNENFTRNVIK
jgi:EPS-associated MarR family transcriptional regulator